ncbi:MAG: vanadium-dependent haloperoxidase [Bacteroidia bacterium]|nr:vanadium-dependent haloperoxidase [Bacteroidia bacterium]
MRTTLLIILAGVSVTLLSSCRPRESHKEPGSHEIHEWNQALDEAIIHDGFNPPVAARIYAYSNLAYYYLLSDSVERATLFPAHLSEMPKAASSPDFKVRAVRAGIGIYHIGRQLVYTDTNLDEEFARWKDLQKKNGWSDQEIEAEEETTKQFTDAFIPWMNGDGYPVTRSMPRYTLLQEEGQWRPTPQDYMDALEPHWNIIRPFLLDSGMQFRPEGPYDYSLDPNSDFMLQFDSLLKKTRNLTEEETAIARHWDDNSVVPIHEGHATTIEKKLTPGGHWMNICRGFAKREKLELREAARIYCQMALAMHDAFITSWEAKYYFHSIRPVTVILDNLDPNWKPFLVTPAFPEYPSGHSTVSAASATILAARFGDEIAFTDSSEVPFGYPPRKFTSLSGAVQEVSDSRFYGGIHFIKALDDGMQLGRNVANYHLNQWPSEKSKNESN